MMKITVSPRFRPFSLAIVVSLLSSSVIGCGPAGRLDTSSTRNSDGVVYQSPEAALSAMKSAFASQDPKRLIAIFGEIGSDIIDTGDAVSDAAFMRKISAKLDQRAELIPFTSPEHPNEQWRKVRFGIEGWNMRIPLVNRGSGWLFATEYSKDAVQEMRREINEVLATDTLFLLVSAQVQYFKTDHDRDGVREYAQRIISTPGTEDGLYWDDSAGGSKSPLDGKVAEAITAGYAMDGRGNPYHGYRYKILFGQAKGTRGQVQSFIENGQMTGGYAVLAYPANWGVSGSKTLIVDSTGRMFKKDLGFRTEAIASEMDAIRLDNTWLRVEHPELGLRL